MNYRSKRRSSPFSSPYRPKVESEQDGPVLEPSYPIRRVSYGGWETVLLGECRDTDGGMSRPVWLDMVGPKTAVRALVSRAMNKDNQAAESNSTTFAFTVESTVGDGTFNSWRCPDDEYRSIVQPVDLSGESSFLPKARRPAMHQGRIVSHLASSLAGNNECYVPVHREIDIPRVDIHGRNADEIWQLYLQSVAHPHSPEFARYRPPLWCQDLYNVYMFLSARVRVPFHENWMPYLFQEARTISFVGQAENADSAKKISGKLLRYVKAYVSPLVYEAEAALNTPLLEHGAYHLWCHPAKEYWQSIIHHNENRFRGIAFQQIEHSIEDITHRDGPNAEMLEDKSSGAGFDEGDYGEGVYD